MDTQELQQETETQMNITDLNAFKSGRQLTDVRLDADYHRHALNDDKLAKACLFAELKKFHQNMQLVPKTGKHDFFNSRFSTLEDIIMVIKDASRDLNLTHTQYLENGEFITELSYFDTTRGLHTSVTSKIKLPDLPAPQPVKKGKEYLTTRNGELIMKQENPNDFLSKSIRIAQRLGLQLVYGLVTTDTMPSFNHQPHYETFHDSQPERPPVNNFVFKEKHHKAIQDRFLPDDDPIEMAQLYIDNIYNNGFSVTPETVQEIEKFMLTLKTSLQPKPAMEIPFP